MLLKRLSSRDVAGKPIDGIQLSDAARTRLDKGVDLSTTTVEKISERDGLRLNRADRRALSSDDGLHLNKDDAALLTPQQGLHLNRDATATIHSGIALDPGTRDWLQEAIKGLQGAIEGSGQEQTRRLEAVNETLGHIEQEVRNVQEVGPRRNVHGTKGE